MKNILLSLVVSASPAAAGVSVVPAIMAPAQMLPGAMVPSVLPAAQMSLTTLPTLAAPVMSMTPVAGPVSAPVATAKETLVLSAGKIGAANNAEAAGTAMNASKEFFDNTTAKDAAPVVINGSPEQINALNAVVAEVFRPYNGALQSVKGSISKVAANDKRVTQLSLSFDYSTIRPKGSASLSIKDFSYSYPDAPSAKPEFNLDMSAKFKLLNAMTQEQINAIGPIADRMLKSYTEKGTKDYGDAAKVEAKITRTDTDAKGNITGLGLELGVNIDLAKLPSGVDPKAIQVTDLKAKLSIGLNGVELSAKGVANPDAKEFQKDQRGLKEALEKLLARDPKLLKDIGNFIEQLQLAADSVTSPKP